MPPAVHEYRYTHISPPATLFSCPQMRGAMWSRYWYGTVGPTRKMVSGPNSRERKLAPTKRGRRCTRYTNAPPTTSKPTGYTCTTQRTQESLGTNSTHTTTQTHISRGITQHPIAGLA